MDLVQILCKQDTISINSENITAFDPCRLVLNIADKINLKRSDIIYITIYFIIKSQYFEYIIK